MGSQADLLKCKNYETDYKTICFLEKGHNLDFYDGTQWEQIHFLIILHNYIFQSDFVAFEFFSLYCGIALINTALWAFAKCDYNYFESITKVCMVSEQQLVTMS